MNVEVILREDFPSLGYVGDKVAVRAGYARNFLLPRGIAVEAFSHNERLMRHQMSGILSKRARLKAQAEELAKRLEGTELLFVAKMGSQGKLFGSVTAKDIEAQLKEKGFAVDRKQVKVSEQMKKAGSYKVQVKLHAEVSAAVTVKVEQEQAEPARAEGEAVKKPSRRGKKADAAAGEETQVAEETRAAEAAPTEGTPKKGRSKKGAKTEGAGAE